MGHENRLCTLAERRGRRKKRRDGEGINLSPYQQILSWYIRYHESYGWTVEQVDESDLATLLDEIIVLSIQQGADVKQERKHGYIENVLPM